MPKTPARDDYFAQSFRFTPEQAATIKEEAKRLGSTTAFVRETHRRLPDDVWAPANSSGRIGSRHEESEACHASGIRSASTRPQIPNAPRGKSHERKVWQAMRKPIRGQWWQR